MSVIKLVGEQLLTKEGLLPTSSVLGAKKLVGIYFSAHWCPPCRKFTPVLAAFYQKLKDEGESFEIVFASSDSDEEEYDEYLKEMPWAAIPFDASDVKDALDAKFQVDGIPTFIVLDAATGRVIDGDARTTVAQAKNAGDAFRSWN